MCKTFAHTVDFSLSGSGFNFNETINGVQGMLIKLKGLTISISADSGTSGDPFSFNLGNVADALAPSDGSSVPLGNAGGYAVTLPAPVSGAAQLYHLPLGDGVQQEVPSAVIINMTGNLTGGDVSVLVSLWGELIPAAG